jgi:ABC-type transport system involved in multi-copper enzyme maturation permease subunit
MLWYKAWRESESRFLISVVTIGCFCLFAVLFHVRIQANGSSLPPGLRSHAYSEHIYQMIYAGTAKGVFAILAIFMGLGGLVRERDHRTLLFSLALPVRRSRILMMQMAVGLSELAVVSAVPLLVIPAASLLQHEYYPAVEAIHFSILWFCCGTIIFAAAFLLSVVLPGEFTAPVVCFIALTLQPLLALWGPLQPYRLNILWTMGEFGTMHWDAQNTLLLTGPLPWQRLLTIMLLAFIILASTCPIAERQDY